MSRFVMRDLQEIRPCNIFFPRCAAYGDNVHHPHTHIHTITLTHKP